MLSIFGMVTYVVEGGRYVNFVQPIEQRRKLYMPFMSMSSFACDVVLVYREALEGCYGLGSMVAI